jgi:hypothetical protein
MEMSPSNQQQGLEKGDAVRRRSNAPEIVRDISSGLLTENEAATEIFLAGNFFWAAGRGLPPAVLLYPGNQETVPRWSNNRSLG